MTPPVIFISSVASEGRGGAMLTTILSRPPSLIGDGSTLTRLTTGSDSCPLTL